MICCHLPARPSSACQISGEKQSRAEQSKSRAVEMELEVQESSDKTAGQDECHPYYRCCWCRKQHMCPLLSTFFLLIDPTSPLLSSPLLCSALLSRPSIELPFNLQSIGLLLQGNHQTTMSLSSSSSSMAPPPCIILSPLPPIALAQMRPITHLSLANHFSHIM